MNDGLLDDYVQSHSRFQIWAFIVGLNGVTPYGKYCQAMRELAVRRETLESAALNLEAIDIRTARVRSWGHLMLAVSRPLGERTLALRIKRVAMERESIVQGIADTQREATEFEQIVRELKEQLGELTEEQRDQLDVETWIQKIALRAAMEHRTPSGISYNTREILAMADPEWRERVLAIAGLKPQLPTQDTNGQAKLANRMQE